MQYDAVVFDNDGVLVEPTPWEVIRSAIREAFARVGVDDPADEHVLQLIGVTQEDVREVAAAYDLDPAALWEARDAAGSEAQIAHMREGGKALYDDVAAIRELDHPRGIVSNNQLATVEAIVDHHGLDEFDPVYARRPTLEDVARKKPDPFHIERALSHLTCEDALYVGDSAKDVVAARRAGCDAAFVRRAHCEDVELPHEPAFEVRDLAELAAQLD